MSALGWLFRRAQDGLPRVVGLFLAFFGLKIAQGIMAV